VVTENSVRSENTGVPTIREIMVATTMSSLFIALFALVASSFRTRAALQAEILDVEFAGIHAGRMVEPNPLMVAVATCSNLLVGYGAHHTRAGGIRLLVLPLVLSLSFFAIADIDSPRRGTIRVHPHNLISLVQSLQGR
jgi:hypothetical protein